MGARVIRSEKERKQITKNVNNAARRRLCRTGLLRDSLQCATGDVPTSNVFRVFVFSAVSLRARLDYLFLSAQSDDVRCSISRSENARRRSSYPPVPPLDVVTLTGHTVPLSSNGMMARDTIVHDVDLPSLEYDDEETAYMATETPSFDADDSTLGSTFVIVDEDTVSDPDDDVDGVGGDDDVSPLVMRPATADSRSSLASAGKVKFLDKIRENKSYQKLARIVKKKGEEPPVIMSPDSGINELQGLSLEEQEKQKEEWQQELNKVEEEIKTLREVLGSKVKASQELRRKLGYTVWQEISEDVSQSLRNVKESNVYQNVEDKFTQIGKAVVDAPIFNFSLPDSSDMRTPTRNMVLKHCYQNVEGKVKQFGTAVAETPIYQKTESVVKTTAEKATTIFGGFGSGLTTKLGQIKNSESFRSFEEKVGSALENVKTKVASRSNSMQNFDEILEEETRLANEEKRSREEREAATK